MTTGFNEVLRDLYKAVPGGVQLDVSLADLSQWKVGGIARAVVTPENDSQLVDTLAALNGSRVPAAIIGQTSNVLFDSEGFRGVVIKLGTGFSRMRAEGSTVVAGAGVSVPKLAFFAGAKGLSGIEHTVGIPGTLGGLVTMNGGSQRRGIGESIRSVHCVTRKGGFLALSGEECEFEYRSSIFQKKDWIVTGVQLQLEPADRVDIDVQHDQILASRSGRFPESWPNCGSTFVSDPVAYAKIGSPGRAIEDAGLKGKTVGGAQVSEQHANFIINRGGCSSTDILTLMGIVREEVYKRTGHTLRSEVRFLTSDGLFGPADDFLSQYQTK